MAIWTDILQTGATWSAIASPLAIGVPYNSDLVYNNLFTYNASEIDYATWSTNNRYSVDWANQSLSVNTWTGRQAFSVNWTD